MKPLRDIYLSLLKSLDDKNGYGQCGSNNALLGAIMGINAFNKGGLMGSISNLFCYEYNERSSSERIFSDIDNVLSLCPNYSSLRQPISYLIDELICNVQQHSSASKVAVYAKYNEEDKCVDICVADNGITILGSYIQANKFVSETLGTDAGAMVLAKEGFSSKNLPNAENRGYGISSNARWIVDGLNGAFSILSGTALYYSENGVSNILSLPSDFEWVGTMVVARIPISISKEFSLYNYIS